MEPLLDLDEITEIVLKKVKGHQIRKDNFGLYYQHIDRPETATASVFFSDDLYACIDAVNIYELLGMLSEISASERDQMAEALYSFSQDDFIKGGCEGSGTHGLSMLNGSLKALGREPRYSDFLELTKEFVDEGYLRRYLRFEKDTWQNEKGSDDTEMMIALRKKWVGLGGQTTLMPLLFSSRVTASWKNLVWEHFDALQNPKTGCWHWHEGYKGRESYTPAQLAAITYHMLLMYFPCGREVNHKEQLIDTHLCKECIEGALKYESLGEYVTYDWLWDLGEMMQVTRYKRDNTFKAAETCAKWLDSIFHDRAHIEKFNNLHLHGVLATVSLIAVLDSYFPWICSGKKWKCLLRYLSYYSSV